MIQEFLLNENKLFNGDCLEVLKTLPDESVDSLITDPPAAIGFMHLDWDSDKGGRKQWCAWLSENLKEAKRVLKPGAHILVWALPRTSHWTAFAIEDAEFQILSTITHIFGSGFPKGQNIGRAYEKILKGHPQGTPNPESPNHGKFKNGSNQGSGANAYFEGNKRGVNYKPELSEQAKPYEDYWTTLKPATEFWILAKKEIKEKNIVHNVVKHGTGALNIGACRVGYQNEKDKLSATPQGKCTSKEAAAIGAEPDAGRDLDRVEFDRPDLKGRFATDLLLTHHPDCEKNGHKEIKSSSKATAGGRRNGGNTYGEYSEYETPIEIGYATDGKEIVENWQCVDGCPVKQLDEQTGILKSGTGAVKKESGSGYQGNDYGKENRPVGTPNVEYGDQGGASRFFPQFEFTEKDFFYCGKSPKSEKTCNNKVANNHPTVKPIKLMTWLVKLITPPQGIVLDIFMGSGSTGVAAVENEFKFIGIEKDENYLNIAKSRIENSILNKKN